VNQTSLRLRWPLLVLLASIAITAIAAFDAQRAIRAQDAVVNRALNEVVSFASWSYGQHLQEQLGNGAREVLGAVNHGDNVHTGRHIPPTNELVHYLFFDQRCQCHQPRRGPVPINFLAIKLGSDRLDVATNTNSDPSEGWRVDDVMPEPLRAERQRRYTAAEMRWIVGTLTLAARTAAPADRGYAFIVGQFRGEPHVFAYTLMPTAWGDTLLYSAEYDRAAFFKARSWLE
jgi:hypothetical protein